MFHLIINVFKKYSNMCGIKTVLTVAALLLAAFGFCKYQVTLEKKMGHHSGIKSGSPRKKEYKKHV